jgi:uncharacterized RDD family membrane protein YckC
LHRDAFAGFKEVQLHPMQWYYVVSGQRLGPVAQTEFEQLVRDGVIQADTLVWREGMAAWQPYAAVAPIAVTPAGGAETGAVGDTELCSVSGKRYPKREMIQFEGKWVSGEHRDAFFQRMREGVTQPGSFNYGNFGRRLVAKILDWIILGVAGMAVNMVLGLVLYGSMNYFKPDPSQINITTILLFQGISFLVTTTIGLSYGIFFIRRYNATPGKMALGLQVIRPDGSTLSVGRIIGRYFSEMLSAMILFIGYILAAFDSERKALHDMICDTRVIKVR